MDCYDPTTHAHYPRHEEWVVPAGPSARAIGVCVRCGEVCDLPCCVRAARDGFSRAATALVAAGLAEPERYAVYVTRRKAGGKVRTTLHATYPTREEAEREAPEQSRPLSREDREDGWVEYTAEVRVVPGRMLGEAARV